MSVHQSCNFVNCSKIIRFEIIPFLQMPCWVHVYLASGVHDNHMQFSGWYCLIVYNQYIFDYTMSDLKEIRALLSISHFLYITAFWLKSTKYGDTNVSRFH